MSVDAERVPSPVLAAVRLARPRYLALTVPPFLVGAAAADVQSGLFVLLGTTAIVVLRGISSIGNCIADRVEDEVDHPDRAVLAQRVGWDALARLVRGLTVVYLLLWLAMVIAVPLEPLPAVMLLIILVLKIAYSFGPRLKPKRGIATLLLGTVSGAMLFIGWTGVSLGAFTEAGTAALVLWAFGASLCGSKDVPNLEGDLRAGYRSIYWDIVGSRQPLVRAIAVMARPYVALAVAAAVTEALGEPPGWRLLWCLVVFPVGVLLATAIVGAQTQRERDLVREYGYLYWLLSMGVVLVCSVPTAYTVAVALGGFAYFLVASYALHPDPMPSWRAARHHGAKHLIIRNETHVHAQGDGMAARREHDVV